MIDSKSTVESAYFSKNIGPIVCVHCGDPLHDSCIERITEYHKTYKTVLSACTNGVCASGPNKGWILKDPSGPPKNVRKKRTRAMLSNQEVAEHTKVIADAQQITQLGSGRSTSEEFTGWHSTMTKYWRSLRALKKPRKGGSYRDSL